MVISFVFLCLIFVHIFLNQLEKCPLLFFKNLITIAHETVPCSDSEIQAKIW